MRDIERDIETEREGEREMSNDNSSQMKSSQLTKLEQFEKQNEYNEIRLQPRI